MSIYTDQKQPFLKTRAFKVLALVVYLYSFIQLDANESPISIEIQKEAQVEQLASVRIQLERPFRLLIQLFGDKESSD